MDITVELSDIIDSYREYLKTKLGKELTSMEVFTYETDPETSEIKKVPSMQLAAKHYVTFKK